MTGTPGSRRNVDAPAARRDAPVRAIFLVGFMGAGKTSVGRALSRKLGWRFEDLDHRIQAREGRTIPEIFQQSGEAEFRRREIAALRELLAEAESDRMVVALGGGAFVEEEVAALLEKAGNATVFLDAPAEELWRRCAQDVIDRPLQRKELEFRQLYERRRPRYLRAQVRVDTEGHGIEQIVDVIVSGLELNSSKEK
jgi:shikimate kinase